MPLDISAIVATKKLKVEDPKYSIRGSDMIMQITSSTNFIVNPSAWFIFSLILSTFNYLLTIYLESKVLRFIIAILSSIFTIFFQLLNDITMKQLLNKKDYTALLIFLDTTYQIVQFTLVSRIYLNLVKCDKYLMNVLITTIPLLGFSFILLRNFIKRIYTLLSSDFNYIFGFLILIYPITSFFSIQKLLVFALLLHTTLIFVTVLGELMPSVIRSSITRKRFLLTSYPIFVNVIVFALPYFIRKEDIISNLFYRLDFLIMVTYINIRLCISQMVDYSKPSEIYLDLVIPWAGAILANVVEDGSIFPKYWFGLFSIEILILIIRIISFVNLLLESFNLNLFGNKAE